MTEVVIVRTGTANLASVVAALSRAGANPRVADDPAVVASAARVVLPGVGAFAAAMEHLDQRGLVAPLAERIRGGRPTLAICLGLQLLAEGSDESPGTPGLGLIAGRASRFGDSVRVPQLGWNRVDPLPGARLLAPGFAYFANSYCLRALPPGWTGANSRYDVPFVSAIERGAVVGCQFHPELSGTWGASLIRRWLTDTETTSGDQEC